ncbi:adenylosuccinate synthase [soil metagenome]
MRPRRATVVVDLGFGDAGKGAVTDALTRARGVTLVVRFNGGAQAGHNVVTRAGVHHTFAQFGAGTLAGARTLLSRFVVVHPTALAIEARHLEAKGISHAIEGVMIDERALVTTPWHQAACRLRELARGGERHGSCGVGVGETVADSLADESMALRTGDLRDRIRLRKRTLRHRDAKRTALAELAGVIPEADEWRTFEDDAIVDAWIDAAIGVAACVHDERAIDDVIAAQTELVFEGAQGVLIDEDHGFHPHTTWSHCTFENALTILREHRFDGAIERRGIHRTHAVRHGAGPFPTEDPSLELAELHNAHGPWQGGVRFGHRDLVLLRYAIAACGGVDALGITHLDRVVPSSKVAVAYEAAMPRDLAMRDLAGRIGSLRSVARADLRHAERLGRALRDVVPVLEPWPTALVPWLERTLGRRVTVRGRGPTAEDYRFS